MRLCNWTVVSLLCLGLSGCAEYVSIYSVPEGAKVYLNGRYTGTTPYTDYVSRADVRPIPYRVEKPDFEPAEGTLETAVAPGRVVAALFTLGLVYAFKSPLYIESAWVELVPSPSFAQGDSSAAVRLRQLEDLRERGRISDEEYEKLRAEILKGL